MIDIALHATFGEEEKTVFIVPVKAASVTVDSLKNRTYNFITPSGGVGISYNMVRF